MLGNNDEFSASTVSCSFFLAWYQECIVSSFEQLSSFLFTGCSFSASRNVSDWWLAYWISHSRGNSTATHHHVNFSSANSLNHLIPRVLTADQLDLPHVHIVKDTITFYLVVYGGLAVANTVRVLVLTLPLSDASVCILMYSISQHVIAIWIIEKT